MYYKVIGSDAKSINEVSNTNSYVCIVDEVAVNDTRADYAKFYRFVIVRKATLQETVAFGEGAEVSAF